MRELWTVLVCGAFFLAAFAHGPAARADAEPATSASKKPVLIVFLIGADEADRAHEALFVQKLRLALDAFTVRTIDLRDLSFANAPWGQRLEKIHDVTNQYDAVASTWIEKPNQKVELLQLVAMSTGRALVHIVEIESGPSSEAELAFAAQELLGQAYMFEAPQENKAVAEVVNRVKQDLQTGDDEAWISSPISFGIQPQLVFRGSLCDRPGPSFQIGGALAAELRSSHGFFARVSLAGLSGPQARFSDGVVTGAGVSSHLFLGYSWRLGPIMLEPLIGVGLIWSRLDMALGYGDNQSFSWFSFRGALGANIILPIRAGTSLSLGGTVGGLSARKAFYRLSNNTPIVTTAPADWAATLGLIFHL